MVNTGLEEELVEKIMEMKRRSLKQLPEIMRKISEKNKQARKQKDKIILKLLNFSSFSFFFNVGTQDKYIYNNKQAYKREVKKQMQIYYVKHNSGICFLVFCANLLSALEHNGFFEIQKPLFIFLFIFIIKSCISFIIYYIIRDHSNYDYKLNMSYTYTRHEEYYLSKLF